MKKLALLLLFVALFSCGGKKLNERRSTIGDLEINRYQISLITSIHDHVEVTKNGETEQILKVNTGDIDTILLVQDTLVIKTIRRPVIYNKKDKVFGYLIKIDSVPVVIRDSMRQK